MSRALRSLFLGHKRNVEIRSMIAVRTSHLANMRYVLYWSFKNSYKTLISNQDNVDSGVV